MHVRIYPLSRVKPSKKKKNERNNLIQRTAFKHREDNKKIKGGKQRRTAYRGSQINSTSHSFPCYSPKNAPTM